MEITNAGKRSLDNRSTSLALSPSPRASQSFSWWAMPLRPIQLSAIAVRIVVGFARPAAVGVQMKSDETRESCKIDSRASRQSMGIGRVEKQPTLRGTVSVCHGSQNWSPDSHPSRPYSSSVMDWDLSKHQLVYKKINSPKTSPTPLASLKTSNPTLHAYGSQVLTFLLLCALIVLVRPPASVGIRNTFQESTKNELC